MFRYLLKTDGSEFEVSKRPVPKTDEKGVQRVDRATGLPVWVVEVTAFTDEENGASVMAVSLASSSVPALRWRERVEVVDLEMIPWANKDRGGDLRQGVSFRASDIRPLQVYASAA